MRLRCHSHRAVSGSGIYGHEESGGEMKPNEPAFPQSVTINQEKIKTGAKMKTLLLAALLTLTFSLSARATDRDTTATGLDCDDYTVECIGSPRIIFTYEGAEIVCSGRVRIRCLELSIKTQRIRIDGDGQPQIFRVHQFPDGSWYQIIGGDNESTVINILFAGGGQ